MPYIARPPLPPNPTRSIAHAPALPNVTGAAMHAASPPNGKNIVDTVAATNGRRVDVQLAIALQIGFAELFPLQKPRAFVKADVHTCVLKIRLQPIGRIDSIVEEDIQIR